MCFIGTLHSTLTWQFHSLHYCASTMTMYALYKILQSFLFLSSTRDLMSHEK
jgi:hypothetical protein